MQGCEGSLLRIVLGCPHLGCTIAWHDDKNKFVCRVTTDNSSRGKLLGGPPPRGMDRWKASRRWQACSALPNFRQLVPNKEVIAPEHQKEKSYYRTNLAMATNHRTWNIQSLDRSPGRR